MNWLLEFLLKIKPNFEEGKKLHWLYPVYEATETILFSTDERTSTAPHIRDSIDIKRVMILVVVSLIPCYVFGAMNVGYQNAQALGIERTWIENLFYGAKEDHDYLPVIVFQQPDPFQEAYNIILEHLFLIYQNGQEPYH